MWFSREGKKNVGKKCVCSAGELVGLEDTADLSQKEPEEEENGLDPSQEPTVVRVANVLMELEGDKLFKE